MVRQFVVYFFVFLFSTIFTVCVFADMTIVQMVESSGVMGEPSKKITMTIYVKGSKVKVDNAGPSLSQIIDMDSGKMFLINSAQKTVMTAILTEAT